MTDNAGFPSADDYRKELERAKAETKYRKAQIELAEAKLQERILAERELALYLAFEQLKPDRVNLN